MSLPIRVSEFERRQLAAVKKGLDQEYEAQSISIASLQRAQPKPKYPTVLRLDLPSKTRSSNAGRVQARYAEQYDMDFFGLI
jgi:hypothetical protein